MYGKLRLRHKLGGRATPWYRRGAVGGVNPDLWLEWENSRYAVNQASVPFSPLQTFTRSTTATYTNSVSAIALAAIDEPRLDYSTGTRGLLMEEERANDMNSTGLTSLTEAGGIGATTENYGIAPDGTQTTLLIERVSSFPFYFKEVSGLATDDSYSNALFVRKTSGYSGANQISLTAWFLGGTGTDVQHTVNLNTNTGVASLAGSTPTNIKVEDYSDFWRVSFTGLNNSTGNTRVRWSFKPLSIGQELEIWGYDLQEGGFITSHIPNATAGSVSRTVDKNKIENIDTADWFNNPEFTTFWEFSPTNNSSGILFSYFDTAGASANRIVAEFTGSGLRVTITTASATQFQYTIATASIQDLNRLALAVKENDIALAFNGVILSTDNSATIPTVDEFGIGNQTGSFTYTGVFHDHRNYPARLTNSEIEELTT